MGSVNKGNQVTAIDYKQELTADLENQKLHGLISPGIVNGLELFKISDTLVQINAGTILINDNVQDLNVKVSTTTDITDQVIAPATPYIIARYTWVDTASNYLDFLNVAIGDIQATDIILGMGDFVSTTLNSFDYSKRLGSVMLGTTGTSSDLETLDTDYESGQVIVPVDEPVLKIGRKGNTYTALGVTNQHTILTVSSANLTLTKNSLYADIIVTTGASVRTITLPDATLVPHREFFIKKIDSGAGTVTIDTTAGNIDGSASKSLATQYDYIVVISDGADYYIKG